MIRREMRNRKYRDEMTRHDFTAKHGAVLSDDRIYRYALWRTWDASKPTIMFIGLNPSTADETTDDPTVRKCIRFAKAWGYGRLIMANLFALRATDSVQMLRAPEPIGDQNDAWINRMADRADFVVAAWGNDGQHKGRSFEVRSQLTDLHCLKVNATGEPSHPLYLKAEIEPQRYK